MHDSLGRILATPLLAEQGVPSATDGRLSTVYIAWLSQFIPWHDSAMWAMAGAATFALGLWFFWCAVSHVFDRRIAWITLVVTALMPVYWREAVWFDNYNLSFLFLFAAMAAYCCFRQRWPWFAFAVAGLCFGLSISAKDAFLVFIPWLFLTFAWKRQWLKGAVFFLLAFAVYILPYIGDIQEYGYPINQNIARVWPGAEDIANETYLHLYPDPYTYYFAREEFDAAFLEQSKEKPLLSRMSDEKLILSYDLEHSFPRRIRLGTWLLLKDVMFFVQRQTVGGVFLWMFILPGIAVLHRRNAPLLWWMLGFIVSMYAGIRFVLLYERQHIMNIAWALSLLASLGISQMAMWLHDGMKKFSYGAMVLILLILTSLQLVQSNRYEFARRYRESDMRETLAVVHAVSGLPDKAAVAVVTDSSQAYRIALLSNRTIIQIRELTIEDLIAHGTLRSLPNIYGVTDIIGYADSIPGVNTIAVDTTGIPRMRVPSWLLHVIR